MQIFSNFFSRTLVLAVIAATIVSCTPAAKKARYAKRGEDYFKAGEYDKAKIEYLNVLRVDQRDANAYGRIGAMWSRAVRRRAVRPAAPSPGNGGG